MPRRRKQPNEAGSKPAVDVPQELLDQLVKGPMTQGDLESMFRELKKAVIERAMSAEMNEHLGYRPGEIVTTMTNPIVVSFLGAIIVLAACRFGAWPSTRAAALAAIVQPSLSRTLRTSHPHLTSRCVTYQQEALQRIASIPDRFQSQCHLHCTPAS